jgi:hypothetical protein
MKRFIVSILAILYLASAGGATLHIHYCMDKIIDISLIDKDKDNCHKCCTKKSTGKGCCKDEHKVIKTSDHSLPKSSIAVSPQHILSSPVYFPSSEKIYAFAIGTPAAHAPPSLWRTCPIYIQTRNLRI